MFGNALEVNKYRHIVVINHNPFPAIFNMSTILFVRVSASLWRKYKFEESPEYENNSDVGFP